MDTEPESADNDDADVHSDGADADGEARAHEPEHEGVHEHEHDGVGVGEDVDAALDADQFDDDIDSDVTGTQSKVTKARVDNPDASVFDRGGGVNSRIGLVVAGIVAVAVIAAFFITRSANNTDLKLVEGSVQESLTPDCFWSILFEVENTTDDPIAVFDTKVATGGSNLIVTQAARDLVVNPNETAQNVVTYYVDNCPADPSAIDHGSLDLLNASLGGSQQTTRLEF